MEELIRQFPGQIEKGLRMAEQTKLIPLSGAIHNIYIAGMGGSGIGGDIVASLVKEESPAPVLSGKDYQVPSYIDENTLALVSSYSGNTEETLYSFNSLSNKKCRVICISSGGKLKELAEIHKYEFVKLPEGWPAPRACLGFSLVAQLYVLRELHITGGDLLSEIQRSADWLRKEQPRIQSYAQEVAEKLKGRIVVIYTSDMYHAAGLRFRQQLNENAKTLCWHQTIPEMNHNEIVGWSRQYGNLAVIFINDPGDFKRTKLRKKVTHSIIKEYCDTVIDLEMIGSGKTEKMMHMIHLTDWISCYLARQQGVDPMDIGKIDYLKSELARHPF